MDPIQLGKFIAYLRNEKKLTQEDLAEKLFIDKRKISRWECGTSIPEFDMLIKLSQILDVSLYELSICKRIESDKISRQIVNKFKSIKDFKKYQFRNKIKLIVLFILFIALLITINYTIKNNGTVEIYKLKGLDEKYYIDGQLYKIKNNDLFYIKQISLTENNTNKNLKDFNNCEYEFYSNDKRIIYLKSNNTYAHEPYYDGIKETNINDIIELHVNCPRKNNEMETYKFNVQLTKIYDNKLF